MNLCSDHHEEICYENDPCPLCEKLVEIEDLEEEIRQLREDLNNA